MNSRNSVGKRIVPIQDLSQKIKGGKPFVRRSRAPIALGVIVVQRAHGEGLSIESAVVVFPGVSD
jgi:hypothetical protein